MPLSTHRRQTFIVLALLALPLCAVAEESSPAAEEAGGYLRVVEVEGESIGLEIAVRTFVPASGEGPTVGLVGIAHVADGVLYETVQDYLGGWDLVLYESVMPAGARGPGGDDDDERADSTRAALGFVASVAKALRTPEGRYATGGDQLLELAHDKDKRYGEWVRRALQDAWGNGVVYTTIAGGEGFELRSMGADGAKGGQGVAADIVIDSDSEIADLPASSADGIQGKLAEALGLEFQLTSIDYGLPTWVCSDMAMDEVSREFKRRGEDFGELQGTLSGSSMNGKMMETMLDLLPTLDKMMGGGMKDMLKVLLIETLGNEDLAGGVMEQQMGSGFVEVILGERNQVVIDDLAALIQGGNAPESIGILYGAAHMKDMEARLVEQLGYERDRAFWMQGISVDMSESPVSPSQLKMIRTMLKTMSRRR